MTANDTCPHCGCSKYNDEVYYCHIKVSDPSMLIGVRSIHYRQLYELKVKIAAKDAEIERLKHESEYWQKAAKKLKAANKKLKAAKILMRGNKVK
jgi:hypothetical protein